jgi:hypothetical protein
MTIKVRDLTKASSKMDLYIRRGFNTQRARRRLGVTPEIREPIETTGS